VVVLDLFWSVCLQDLRHCCSSFWSSLPCRPWPARVPCLIFLAVSVKISSLFLFPWSRSRRTISTSFSRSVLWIPCTRAFPVSVPAQKSGFRSPGFSCIGVFPILPSPSAGLWICSLRSGSAWFLFHFHLGTWCCHRPGYWPGFLFAEQDPSLSRTGVLELWSVLICLLSWWCLGLRTTIVRWNTCEVVKIFDLSDRCGLVGSLSLACSDLYFRCDSDF
jgi:hypothetical protein